MSACRQCGMREAQRDSVFCDACDAAGGDEGERRRDGVGDDDRAARRYEAWLDSLWERGP